jgi:agmatinase
MQGTLRTEFNMNYKPGLFAQPKNFAGLSSPYSDFDYAKVVVLPVPYDSTTEWHAGSRNGPKSIIEASYYLEWYDIELEKETYNAGIHTLPELEPDFSSPEAMIRKVYEASKYLLDSSKFIVTFGGEHSISLGSIQAHIEKFQNCSVLQLDAHTDLRDQYLGTKFGHACIMRRAANICPITQVGIRAISLEEKEYIASQGMSPFFLNQPDMQLPVESILTSLSENVYITIDLDVFDPSIMSAVGTPEPGGLLWHQVLPLVKKVCEEKNVVGFDMVELCPEQGPASCSFLAAKLAYKLLGYKFAAIED